MKAPTSVSLRRAMVESLEASGAIASEAVRLAFLAVEREHFVSELVARNGLASIYRPDVALATAIDGRGAAISSSSAAAIMAPMLEALRLEPGQRVLEIGAGTGYNAALLKHLVGPRGRVTTVDLDRAFAERARRSLAAAGYAARVVAGDGRDGWASGAPYDRIIVTASTAELYRPWLDQLVEGGLLEAPFRLSKSVDYQIIATFERHGDVLSSTTTMAGSFMPLRGSKAIPAEQASHSLSAFARGSKRPLLASIEGPPLERLSAQGRRRALATLLEPGRIVSSLSANAAGGLIAFLLLRGRGPFCSCAVNGGWGTAVVADRGRSIATVTRRVGGVGRVESFGSGAALMTLDRYRDAWSKQGSPTASDLRLAASFGATRTGREWRRMPLGASVVTINWD